MHAVEQMMSNLIQKVPDSELEMSFKDLLTKIVEAKALEGHMFGPTLQELVLKRAGPSESDTRQFI